VDILTAQHSDRRDLAAVAAATFPLACPPSAAPEDIAAFVAANLSESNFEAYLTDPARVVLAAADAGRIVGYAMLIRTSSIRASERGPEFSDTGLYRHSAEPSEMVELSKMYVLPAYHHTGAAAALISSGIDWASGSGAARVWLGVNQYNHKAQRFYRKYGFEVCGTRSFRLGASLENDFVMVRPLDGRN